MTRDQMIIKPFQSFLPVNSACCRVITRCTVTPRGEGTHALGSVTEAPGAGLGTARQTDKKAHPRAVRAGSPGATHAGFVQIPARSIT